jgi:hypothetical protein
MPLTKSFLRSRKSRLAATALWLQRKHQLDQQPDLDLHPPALRGMKDSDSDESVSDDESDSDDELSRNAARQLLLSRFSCNLAPPVLQAHDVGPTSDEDVRIHSAKPATRSERDFVVNALPMSRETVRHALSNLSRIGLILESVPGDGYVEIHPTLFTI